MSPSVEEGGVHVDDLNSTLGNTSRHNEAHEAVATI